ncbi:hypothetical protein I552_0021 [Mycobacterium xenopi 3993]|nr:hypothetical protein I552_0021 [Mycobacterium xenopi 3993]
MAPKEFALSTLRDIYSATLGYQVDATNLQRVLPPRRHHPDRHHRPVGPQRAARPRCTASPTPDCGSPTSSPRSGTQLTQ